MTNVSDPEDPSLAEAESVPPEPAIEAPAAEAASAQPPLPAADWSAHRMRPGEEEAVLAIFDSAFDRWPPWDVPVPRIDFLRWATEEHGEFAGWADLSFIGERPASAALRLIRPAHVRGRQLTARLGLYHAVHPDFRGLGIYTRMREENREPADIGWGFSLVPQVRRLRLRNGEVPVGNELAVFVSVRQPLKAARHRATGKRLLNIAAYSWLGAQGMASRRPASGWRIRPVTSFDDRVDELFGSALEAFDFIPDRTSAYLNWRFGDARSGGFQLLEAEDELGRLDGYLVWRNVGSRGHIADMLVRPGREGAAHALLAAARGASFAAGATAVECAMMLRHPYSQALRRAGFVRAPSASATLNARFSILATSIDPAELAFTSAPDARIHIMEGDSDLI